MKLRAINIKLLLLLFMTGTIPAWSETEDRSTHTVGTQGFYGHLWVHADVVEPFAGIVPKGGEVFFNINTYGDKPWHSLYNYPDIGFSLSYFSLDHDNLGMALFGISYMDFYLLRKERHKLTFRIGTGISYFDNPYDKEENPGNEAIGSRINMNMQGRLMHHLSLTSRWNVQTAVTLSHLSNGDYSLPNRGLNIFTLNLGVSYLLEENRPGYIHNPSETPDRTLRFGLAGHGSVKSNDRYSNDLYPAWSAAISAEKWLTPANIFHLRLEGFYDLALQATAKERYSNSEMPDFRRAGVTLGHEMPVGRVSLMKHFGYYFYKPFDRGADMYQRYGLRYYHNDHFFSRLTLKTHWGRADFIDLGLGIRY